MSSVGKYTVFLFDADFYSETTLLGRTVLVAWDAIKALIAKVEACGGAAEHLDSISTNMIENAIVGAENCFFYDLSVSYHKLRTS